VWEAEPATVRFTFVSQRAEDLLGYPVVEWLKDPEFLGRILHPEDRGRTLAAIRAAVSEGKDQEVECRMLAVDGREVWVRDRVTVVRSERGVETVLGLIVDVTERKRTEQALARLYQRAEEESRRKDEFLAILGHELRTPLGTLANAVHLLRSGDRAAARAAVDTIARVTHHLTALTRDLFDIASVVSGKLQLDRQPVELGRVVTEAVHELQARARRRGQTLAVTAEPGVVVEGDPVRLAQIVTNLVDNALKYSAGVSASGWPWSGGWSSCTAAACGRSAPAPARAASSSSGSRRRRPRPPTPGRARSRLPGCWSSRTTPTCGRSSGRCWNAKATASRWPRTDPAASRRPRTGLPTRRWWTSACPGSAASRSRPDFGRPAGRRRPAARPGAATPGLARRSSRAAPTGRRRPRRRAERGAAPRGSATRFDAGGLTSDQDEGGGELATAGIRRVKVVPAPGRLRTLIVAPGCLSTSPRTMDSPSPVPSAFVV
jgi:PAS domain S-box-containing protein